MFDDTNIPDTQPDITETAEETQAVAQQAAPAEDAAAKNFRQLREKSDRIARERDEAMSRLREYESKAKAQESPSDDDEFSIGPDDLAEGKHLSKVQRQIKKLKEEINTYKQQTSTMTTEARLKTQYPDFDTVVSRDNVEEFRASYPELAQTLNASTDLYATAVSAYTLIKKFGIGQQNAYNAEKEIIQKNAAKPRPLTSVSPQQGDTPLSRANAFANGLTEDLKEQLRKEMYAFRKS